jgi:MFS family permease
MISLRATDANVPLVPCPACPLHLRAPMPSLRALSHCSQYPACARYIVLAEYGPSGHAAAERTSVSLVSLFSVFSCLGRLSAGMGSDSLEGLVSRPSLFACACALMGAAHALLLAASAGTATPLFYAASICAGFSFGAFWALVPTLVADLFGLSAFASTYNVYTLAVAFSSLLMSTQLASRVARAHTLEGASSCYGTGCYRLTHLVVIGCCGLGVLASMTLGSRTSGFYAMRRSSRSRAQHDELLE